MDLREHALTGAEHARHPWELARADVVRTLLAKLPERESPLSILDFGCGDAFVAGTLARALPGARIFAVDSAFTPQMRQSLGTHLSENVRLLDSLDALEASGASPASLVLLLDVLEHCENDREVLERLVRSPAVGSGAHFLITVPAFQSLFCEHDRFLGHHRRYRLDQIRAVATQAGLRPDHGSYFFSSLLLPRAVQVGWEKVTGPRPVRGLGAHSAKPLLDSLIRGVLRADFRVCEALTRAGIQVPGLSCFVLARKP